MNFLFESFGISAIGETPEERRWREFREQQGPGQAGPAGGAAAGAERGGPEGPGSTGAAGAGAERGGGGGRG